MKFLRQQVQADLPGQMGLHIPGHGGDGPLLLRGGGFFLCPAAEQADLQVVDAAAELLIVHRLEDIVGDLEPQRLAAVGEVVIAGHDDKGDVRMLHAAELDDLQAVHDGDIDIHDGDVRQKGVDLGQGLHAVGGLPHHLAVVGLPVEQPLEALPNHDLVVHQQYPQLFHGVSSFMGSSSRAVTPPPSFSV